MSRRAHENIVAGCVLAFFLAIIVLSFDYSPRARFVPMPVAVLGVILVTIQLVWQNLRSPDELHVDVLELLTGHARNADGDGGGAKAAARDADPGARKQLIAFGMVALLLAGFLLLGPIPSILVSRPDGVLPLGEEPCLCCRPHRGRGRGVRIHSPDPAGSQHPAARDRAVYRPLTRRGSHRKASQEGFYHWRKPEHVTSEEHHPGGRRGGSRRRCRCAEPGCRLLRG
jgi:hypothetical protein